MGTNAKKAHSRRQAGFTLVEILVATVLLSMTLAATMALWSVSRGITERSREAAEYYTIAQHEVEASRAGFSIIPVVVSDYTQDGGRHAVPGGFGAPLTPIDVAYRVKSTYSLVSTEATPFDPTKWLGVQIVELYPVTGTVVAAEPVHRTTAFFSGDWNPVRR